MASAAVCLILAASKRRNKNNCDLFCFSHSYFTSLHFILLTVLEVLCSYWANVTKHIETSGPARLCLDVVRPKDAGLVVVHHDLLHKIKPSIKRPMLFFVPGGRLMAGWIIIGLMLCFWAWFKNIQVDYNMWKVSVQHWNTVHPLHLNLQVEIHPVISEKPL